MNILDSVLSVISGGATGVIGSAVSSIYAYKAKQIDADIQKAKMANDVELLKANGAIEAQEWAARTQVAQITSDAAVDAEDAKAFTAAQTSEPQKYATGALTAGQNWLMVVLDLFRGLIRPSLTVYLAVLTTIIYLQARELIGNGMAPEQATQLVSKIIDTVLYLTTTTVLFWFGSRAHDKKGAK